MTDYALTVTVHRDAKGLYTVSSRYGVASFYGIVDAEGQMAEWFRRAAQEELSDAAA